MIGFDLSQEQKDLRDMVHEFARDVIRPAAPQYDESEETPWPIMQQAHEIGIDTYAYPEEYGGGGVTDMLTQMVVTEELTWGWAGIAIAINASSLCATAVQQCGTPEQKAKYMPMFCDPKQVVLGAMGLTEAEAGSDVSALRTSAKRVEGGYLLNGAKRFITNGGIADIHVIFATTKPIAGHQAIAFKLADMATEIEAVRLLIWKAAWTATQGRPFAREASMAKLKAGDVAMRVTDEAIQILGGYGYIRDFPVEKWHRDAKIYQIWEGTAEIQRLVIAREITGRAL